jgi:DNA-3-methyladenine glycosylase I
MSASSIVVGEDGRPRCAWAGQPQIYRDYHDDEWALPVRGDRALFERLSLEAFQSGLSWLTILNKRPAFRAAFGNFDPVVVSTFNDQDTQRLLADAGIVRNRAKIDATISNARALVRLWDRDGPDALDALMWSFAPGPSGRARPTSLADIPATSLESVALSKALKQVGFVWLGPTTVYAAMQAVGIVDDHLSGCHRGQ